MGVRHLQRSSDPRVCGPARGWFEAISLTDVFDFTWGLLAGDRITPAARATVLVLAGGSAAQAAYAASGVDES